MRLDRVAAMIYDEYIAYSQEYQAKYGPQTVVLMEIGDFYEIYGVDNETERAGADMNTVCDVLNIQMSRKNKSILENSRRNPLMAGFPKKIWRKYVDVLVGNQYTVVLVDQVTPPPQPQRRVTQVISPGTHVEAATGDAHHYVMAVLVSAGRYDGASYAAAAWVDIATSDVWTYECPYMDLGQVSADISAIVLSMAPREIAIWTSDKGGLPEAHAEHWRRWLAHSTGRYTSGYDRLAADPGLVCKPSYQNVVLRRVYPDRGILDPLEYTGLARHPMAASALVWTLNFLYEHNDRYVVDLKRPIYMEPSYHLVVAHHALEHLNILGPQGLLSLLNQCTTPMGRRAFREAIIRPSKLVSVIDERLDDVEYMTHERRAYSVVLGLKRIHDVERWLRRWGLGVVGPSELAQAVQTAEAVQELAGLMGGGHMAFTHMTELASWQRDVAACILPDDLARHNLATLGTSTEHTLYPLGVFPEWDTALATLRNRETIYHELVAVLNRRGPAGTSYFKLETNDRGELAIYVTAKRYEAVMKLAAAEGASLPPHRSQAVSTSTKSAIRITPEGIPGDETALREKLRAVALETFDVVIKTLYAKHRRIWERMSEWIARLDVAATNARTALERKYVRPHWLAEEKGQPARIEARDVRHPLIESLQTDVAYVPNDVTLGGSGILLYGINAVGKSSYMKSIGLGVIMAQAGMYVPASSWGMTLYDHVFTRIPGGDNLFRGQSTFVAEMMDLRCILREATSRSLVIGDELCSGTETVSAIAIVAAGILELTSRAASFVFATHLHELVDIDSIRRIETLAMMHMGVRFDEGSGLLVYERKLQPGSGATLYGLEVCKSLDLDPAFLRTANRIRQGVIGAYPGQVVAPRPSHFNEAVFVDRCALCGEKAEEIHHIQRQADADAQGFVDHRHKNHKSNLTGVCGVCHDRIHRGEVVLEGYVLTSEGVRLAASGSLANSSRSGLSLISTDVSQSRVSLADQARAQEAAAKAAMEVKTQAADEASVAEEEEKEEEPATPAEEARALRAQGQSLAAIARTLHVSVYRVKQWLAS